MRTSTLIPGISLLKTQLELKDKFVANLSDRFENIRLEYEEGAWSSVKSTRPSDCATQETTASETSPGRLIETNTTNVINPPSIFGVSRTPVQEAENGAMDTADLTKEDDNTPTEAVCFHDAIHKYLDPSKLSKDTDVHLTMRETYTLSELYNNVKGLKGGELILSHVDVNDIKQGEIVDHCVKKYTNLLEDITIKGHKCIISLLTPTKDLTANSNKGPNT